MSNARSRHAVALALFVSVLLVGGFASSAAADEAPLDPVIVDVVGLLEAQLGEPLIVRWLEENDARPGPLSAADLVALKRAGATDELVATLLDRARPAEPAPPAAPPAPAVPSPARAPAPTMSPQVPPAPSPAPTAPAPAPPDAAVPVTISMRYIHIPDEGEAWDLVVYLDGTPWPPMRAASSERSATVWSGERTVAPGPHLVRWAQELHRRRGDERPRHAARFDTHSLSFDLAPGTPATIAFEYRDRSGVIKRFGGPIDARVVQGDRELAALHTNDDPGYWDSLCEEIEATLDDRKPGYEVRRALKRCTRWADLWSGVAGVPPRDEVRPPVE